MADECLCFRVRRASRALTRLYDEALRPLEIQATQLPLLNAIAVADGAPMSRLANVLAMDPTTLSRNLRPLKEAGLVRLERSADDGRVRLVLLTEEGARTIEEAFHRWERAHERVVAVLGPELAGELREQFDAAVAAADPSP